MGSELGLKSTAFQWYCFLSYRYIEQDGSNFLLSLFRVMFDFESGISYSSITSNLASLQSQEVQLQV